MRHSHGAEADHVGKRKTGVRMLPVLRLAAQLPCDLGDLADAGRAEGMAHADQSSGGIDRANSADPGCAARQVGGALPWPIDADCFTVDELLDRERVVELNDVELARTDFRLL